MVAYIIKEEYENKSLKELIEDRNNLLIKLKKFEDEYIFNTPEIDECTKPSPETIYCVNNQNLMILTELINEKIKNYNLCKI